MKRPLTIDINASENNNCTIWCYNNIRDKFMLRSFLSPTSICLCNSLSTSVFCLSSFIKFSQTHTRSHLCRAIELSSLRHTNSSLSISISILLLSRCSCATTCGCSIAHHPLPKVLVPHFTHSAIVVNWYIHCRGGGEH